MSAHCPECGSLLPVWKGTHCPSCNWEDTPVIKPDTPQGKDFAHRLRGAASFLASNYKELSRDEAQTLVTMLESAANHVEAWKLAVSKSGDSGKCFWPTGCSDRRRCREFGGCVAQSQHDHREEIARPLTPSASGDTARLDWLATKVVEVREPLVHGSRQIFYASPNAVEGAEDEPSDIREKIDAVDRIVKN